MLTFDNVSFRYPGGPWIFRDLLLELRPGKTTAVMGVSGSGKTTLLKLACGLVLPTSGRVRVGDNEVQLGSVRGVVFHEDTLLPWLTVQENVVFGSSITEEAASAERARALLDEFGLADAVRAYPHELSEGMRKRVEFARALISDSSMLLLDEPFVSLDRRTRRQFWGLWRDTRHKMARTTMIITHDEEEAKAIADDLVVLEAGRPVAVRATVDPASAGEELTGAFEAGFPDQLAAGSPLPGAKS